ncbi:sulfurtransferase [Mucilaginibacter myungsuensis]|uniref:Sulfurtransferase n=1 Tax=Mucilaginibacter myungsuensis TaxID=649104 RepID=A0A929PVG3_9SPHI|nr:sulfurtransferase [Mucilaginibacter myungsuensis]MBE9660981.1 sulfurtransferase [Mucilaginibacter myungsuensis]MDN3601027.1 sulfurtransferase [Mucilaginibacter myungsuensis]
MSPIIEITDAAINAADTIIIDARGGADAHQRYLAGHLPNAIFASLDDDLAAHPDDPAFGGRHPLPAPEVFAQTLTRWGVTPDSHVVIYDDKNAAMGAARLWWMFRAIGHQKVQVINGGLKAAIDAGATLSTDDVQPTPADVPYPNPSGYSGTVDIDTVAAAAQSDEQMVIDVRENARYLGHTEPLDLIAGHIPGADNLFYGNNLNAYGKYKSPNELAAIYKETFGDVPADKVIVHCGSGVTACHTLLGMAYAGINEPKLYVGSWSEWSRRGLPIAGENK